MVMKKDEIAAMYREAANKSKEVRILAELNDCSPLLIKEVINGYYPGTFDLGIENDEVNTKKSVNQIDDVLNSEKSQQLQLARASKVAKKTTQKKKTNAVNTPHLEKEVKPVEKVEEKKAAEKTEESQYLQLASGILEEINENVKNLRPKAPQSQYLQLRRTFLPTIRDALTEKLARLKEEEQEVRDALEEIKEGGCF